MADFSKSKGAPGQLRIVEERKFTNPHIRFVRINGRVVPILNKKRIGQTLNTGGNAFVTAGAVLTAVGVTPALLKRRRIKKILANPRTSKIFLDAAKANAGMFKQSRHTGLALSKFGKRSLITGIALGVVGVAAKIKGFSVQADSPLGADL